MNLNLRILVRGTNDVASAVAHALFRSGYAVALHDAPLPTATRRQMAFTDAIFDGKVTLEQVEAVRLDHLARLRGMLVQPRCIPVVVCDFKRLLDVMHPQVLVDARMRKHSHPANQRSLASLIIGLGPNFIAGETVHLAIETGWGESLGKVVQHGPTNPLAGEPKTIEGHSRDRYVYAPGSGKFETDLQSGALVSQGQLVARIGDTPLHAPISGVLRGLTHSGVPMEEKTKVIEIDPRSDAPQISGIAERPAKIAQGVLGAIQLWEQAHVD